MFSDHSEESEIIGHKVLMGRVNFQFDRLFDHLENGSSGMLAERILIIFIKVGVFILIWGSIS